MARRSVSAEDWVLGSHCPIARRDVLHGAGLLAAAGALGGTAAAAEEGTRRCSRGCAAATPAPSRRRTPCATAPSRRRRPRPTRTAPPAGGGRGRDQRPRRRALLPRCPTRRQVLILDNHDDFGGHARRNEFRADDGRPMLMNGGTMSIDSPRPYGAAADGLLRGVLGVRPEELEARCSDRGFYARQGCGRGVFLDREAFGADHLAPGIGERPWTEALRDASLPARVRDDIVRLHEAAIDYLPGLTSDEKKARLARMSYRDYLLRVAGADPGALPFLQAMSHGGWGVGADAVGALDLWALGFPGFRGLGLAPGAAPGMGHAAAGYAGTGGSARFHFPGGNASIARLLVRRLVPGAIPGRTAEDVVAARADYARLDRPGAGVRLRLSRR